MYTRVSHKSKLLHSIVKRDVDNSKTYDETPQAPSIAIKSQDISHKLVQDADFPVGFETEANRGRISVSLPPLQYHY